MLPVAPFVEDHRPRERVLVEEVDRRQSWLGLEVDLPVQVC